MHRAHRLRKPSEFERVRRGGRTWGNALVVLHALRRAGAGEPTRCGFAVSRRVGKAAVRNKVRRRLREIVRRALPSLAGGWDLVLVARPAAARACYSAIHSAIDDLVRRSRLSAAERPGRAAGPGATAARPTGPAEPAGDDE